MSVISPTVIGLRNSRSMARYKANQVSDVKHFLLSVFALSYTNVELRLQCKSIS